MLLSSVSIIITKQTINIASHGTIRFVTVGLLHVVHCDHASIWQRYGDMAPQTLDACTDAQVILYSANAMHCTEQTTIG